MNKYLSLKFHAQDLILFFFIVISCAYTFRTGIVYMSFYCLVAVCGIYLIKTNRIAFTPYLLFISSLFFFAVISYMTRCEYKNSEWFRIVGYIAILVVIFVLPKNIDLLKKVFKPLKYLALFYYALGIYMECFIPPLYRIIMKLLYASQYAGTIYGNNVAENNALRVDAGYYTGFALDSASSGFFVLLGLIIIAYELLADKKNQRIKIIQMAYLIIALVLTGKRAHLLFATLAYIVVSLFSSKNKQKVFRIFKLLCVLTVIILACFAYYSYFGETTAIGRLVSSVIGYQQGEDVTSFRSTLNLYSWSYIHEHFFTGIGWGNIIYYNDIRYGLKINAHNVYLQFWAENGIYGLVFLILYFAVNLLIAIQTLVKTRKFYMEYFSYMQFAVFVEVFFIAYCYTGNPLYDPAYLITYCFALLLVYVVHCRTRACRMRVQYEN